MKTIFKIMLAVVLCIFTTAVFASGNLRLNILPMNEEKALVNISALSGVNFNVTITNEKGQVVYYQEDSGSDQIYRKIFNFSELEDGTYRMKVACTDLSTERFIEKKRDKITVGEENTTQSPFFGVEGNILKCTYLNFDNDNITLHLYDRSEELYLKSLGKNFNIQHALNLSQLKSGRYEAVLTAGNKQFIYNVEIK